MANNYYVWMREPNGDHLRYGPYAMKAAKDFARIGSQFGGPRVVTRGFQDAVFRIYADGKREYPKEA